MPELTWLSMTIAAVVTALSVLLLRTQAERLGLLDLPGGHKQHLGAVPVIGGLAMFVGLMAAMAAAPGGLAAHPAFVLGCLILVAMGAYDDAKGLSPRPRLVGHVLVASLVFYFSPHNVRLETLGDFLGVGPIALGIASLPFTVFVMVAAINAFNMLDGLDGLAGGVALAAGVILWAVVGQGSHAGLLPLVAALVGAAAGFLLFNAPTILNRPVRTFMGDAGSTLIGFTLATVLVSVCQGDAPRVSPVNAVWFLFLPATEVIQSTLRRVLSGRSPFAPDRGHLHHQLRAAGMSVRGIFFLVTTTTLLGACIGLWFEAAHAPQLVSFLTLIGASATYTGVISALVARSRAHTLAEESESVLADGIGDVPHVQDVEGLDQRHYQTRHGRLSTFTNPHDPVRPRFVTPEFGPPDVEPAADSDVA